MLTLAHALRIGLTLPEVEKSVYWGSPALKIRGKMMACVPTHKSAGPESLLIRIDRRDRAALIAEVPELYNAPEHYLNYDAVLVCLARCIHGLLHDLLAMSYRFACPRFGCQERVRRSEPVERVTHKTSTRPASRRKSRPREPLS
ncbi:MAG TPA: MmcQ/YjbR family DNA-binding protein [Acidobacteriaceae bacterium]|jgi:hypothetical protein|nr:MmcQ/YjbR family DNA-binding protein [Acidobacteriaceae bacterium]